MNEAHLVTADSLTEWQIRDAVDRWPEHISSEISATALGIPESHTSGGLPCYPPAAEIEYARKRIAILLSGRQTIAAPFATEGARE